MKKFFIYYKILVPVLLLWFFTTALQVIPPSTVTNFLNREMARFGEFIGYIFIMLVYSFIYGWITYLIVNAIDKKEISLIDGNIKYWLPRSIFAMAVVTTGFLVIDFLISLAGAKSFEIVLSIFLKGIWITGTFIFYPLLIVGRSRYFYSLVNTFKITLYSVNKWFYLLLLLFFISGGVTFIWLPEYWANKFVTVESAYTGWMTHLRWLGGYSFWSYWFEDLTTWLHLKPPSIAAPLVVFINILTATFVKIKVTQILFVNGYLSESAEIEEHATDSTLTVEERYLAKEPFEI